MSDFVQVNYGRRRAVTPKKEVGLPDGSSDFDCHISSVPVDPHADYEKKLCQSQVKLVDFSVPFLLVWHC